MTLDASRWKKVEGLLDEALDLPQEAWSTFLENACQGDVSLEMEVMKLLKAEHSSSNFLENNFIECVRRGLDWDEDAIPKNLQDLETYHIEKALGWGGMGRVFLARHLKMDRLVALKMIRADVQTRDTRARFEAEFRLLARMEHINIARIYQIGYTDGVPYFTMEYIPGQSLSAFLEDQTPTLKDRLQLFLQICEGVRHAHLKGIIHRDLKPSNILVSMVEGRPTAKIIDFGIARFHEESQSGEALTRVGVVMGTPAFMSPEQVEGGNVDTRSDVYALGALLYQFLTDRPPVDMASMEGLSHSKMLQRLLESSPGRPSQIDGSITVKGELDWVVMKALEKEPDRRYQTVNGFMDDVKAWLEDRPVSAGSPGMLYPAMKFIRRHRFGVTALVLIFFSLSGGLIQTNLAKKEAENARELAQEKSRVTEEALNILVETLTKPGPRNAGRNVMVLDVLPTVGEIEERFTDQPELQGRLLDAVGDVYEGLGNLNIAEPYYKKALYLLKEESIGFGDNHPIILEIRERLANLAASRGRYDKALVMYHEVVENRHPGLDQWYAIRGMANCFMKMGRPQEAVELYDMVLLKHLEHLGEEHEVTLATAKGLGMALRKSDHPDSALDLLTGTHDLMVEHLGIDHPESIFILNDLGNLALERGDKTEALSLYEEAFSRQTRILSVDHPETLTTQTNLCEVLRNMDRYQEALPFCKDAVTGRVRVLGPCSEDTLDAKLKLALCLRDSGQGDEAVSMQKEVINSFEALRNIEKAFKEIGNLASTFNKLKRYQESEELCRNLMKRQDPNTQDYNYTLANLGESLHLQSRPKEALPYLITAYNHGVPVQTIYFKCLQEFPHFEGLMEWLDQTEDTDLMTQNFDQARLRLQWKAAHTGDSSKK